MSGVYERNRSTSALEWMTCAREIRKEINRLVRSEKVVFKSQRFTFGTSLFEIARDLTRHTRAAYDRYPNTPRSVLERKHYLQLAIDDCYYLEEELQFLKEDNEQLNLNRLAAIADLLEMELGELKKAKNNTRLTGKQTVDARIEKLEAELADLKELTGSH